LSFKSFTFTYINVGFTHNARLLGNVHGVVVHATRETEGSFSRVKLTMTIIQNTHKILIYLNTLVLIIFIYY
jgi:hypothetical protein